MPKVLNDERDPFKYEMGLKLKKMKKEEPEKLVQFLQGLSEEEADQILYDHEIWARENQYIRLDSKTPIHFMSLGRGSGKLLCKETEILTVYNGFQKLGDLEVGDYVFDERGKPTKILGVYDNMPEKAYRLTFSDNSVIDACSEHLWNTWTHRDRKQFLRQPENKGSTSMPDDWPNWEFHSKVSSVPTAGPSVKTTQEIVDTFYQQTSRADINHSVPVTDIVEIPDVDLPVDPYLFGYWIGDGTKGASSFTCDPKDQPSLINFIQGAGYTIGNNKCYKTVSVLGFIPDMKATGAFNNKSIPEKYLHNSPKNRLAFLQGLMDSDGYCSPSGNGVEFCSMTKSHAEAVMFLAASFGAKPVLSEGRAMLDGVDYGTKYRVIWNPTPKANPFRLERKAERVKFAKSQGFRNCHRMIKTFEEIQPKPMRCLSVDSPNNLFLAGRTLIPTHNTYTGATTVKRAVEKHGIKSILVIAATSRDLRGTIAPAIIESYSPRDKNRPYFSPAKSQIIWPSGSVATCLSAEAGIDSPRGGNHSLCWLDEASFYFQNEGIIDQALLTLRIEPSIMLITTTPKATPKMIELYARGDDEDDKMVTMYRGSTYENAENLSDIFMDSVVKKYENTREGQVEIEGKLILSSPSALWHPDTILRNTIERSDLPEMVEVCIGVDPAVLAKKTSAKGRTPDSTGIVVVGKDANNTLYSLEGHTGSYTVEGWVNKVCALHDKYSVTTRTTIAIEINVLGEQMVEMSFKQAGRNDVAKYIKTVFATQSKLQRASPYSLMAEQDKIKYVDNGTKYLHDLTTELITYDGTGSSPNSLDAFCWACSQLRPVAKQYTVSREFII